MVVLHVPDLGIVRHADLVVRAQDQTGPFTPQELPDGLDLFRRGLLLGDHVIQSKHEQGVGIRQGPLVEGQLEAGLVDPLEHREALPGGLTDELLERGPGPEEQLQRAGDSLLELQRVRPLGRLVGGPGHPSHLGHCRESVVQFRGIPAGLGRVAPRDVHAHPPPPRRVLPRHMGLVVGPRRLRVAHVVVS